MALATRRIASVVSWVFVSAALLIAALIFILTTVFEWQFSTVLTGSMEPRYPVGSAVIVVPVEPQDVKVGDVITFNKGDRRVTHRVVEVRGEENSREFITRGDANNGNDTDPVRAENIVGRARGDIPFIGEVFLWVKKPVGLGLIVGIATGVIVMCFFDRSKSTVKG